MWLKSSILVLSLALGTAACAHAQQGTPPPAQPPQRTLSGTMVNPNPPRAYFGLGLQQRAPEPPLVAEVESGSPAAKAGLLVGDVLVSVDGRDARERGLLFPGAVPGKSYTLRVIRGGAEREIVIVAAAP